MTLQVVDIARQGVWELAVRNYVYLDTAIKATN